MMLSVALLTIASSAGAVVTGVPSHNPQDRAPYEQKIPDSLASFRMVPLPDGKITLQDRTYEIKGLFIGETEVTWDVFDVYAFKLDVPVEEHTTAAIVRSRPSKPYGAPDHGFGHEGYPALCATFNSAQMFCAWLSAKTGKKYRLPTEAEWEYAARAGKDKLESKITDLAWVSDNAKEKTHPVKQKKPNAWGLYDMLGNAGEWCKDMTGEPVLCGGCWMDKGSTVNPSTRAHQDRSWNKTDPQMPKSRWWLSDGFFVGLRVVCEG
ncbi:MAG: formylglycine-generating enzyme family protein [Armatimonadetes bacterium]|nr:formylglycine-generating enzyme family protein [Armatimonadota bacterium]